MYTIKFTLGVTALRHYNNLERALGALHEMIRDGVKDAVLTHGLNILVEVVDGKVIL